MTPTLEPWLHNDFHFSMPNTAPVRVPVNSTVRFAPPSVNARIGNPAIPHPLPQGTFFNSANPGRVKLNPPRNYRP